jgi:hypothetical protein
MAKTGQYDLDNKKGVRGSRATADKQVVTHEQYTELKYLIDSVMKDLHALVGIYEIKEFFTNGSGSAFAISDLCYLKDVSGALKMDNTDASAEATGKGLLGIALEVMNDGASGKFLLYGKSGDIFTGLTLGSQYYMSETANAITTTKPTTTDAVQRIVGYALSTTELFFDPASSYTIA